MSKKDEVKESKYGVEDFAKMAEVEPATARVLLRRGKIKKTGRSYGWDSTGAMKKDLEKCRNASPAPKADKKPAKKAKKKVTVKRRAKTEEAGAEA